MQVLIWGTGKCAQIYLEEKELNEDNIVGFVESNPTKRTFTYNLINQL